jgi:hypothetical protein
LSLRERWRIAGTIAQEFRFNGYLEANPANLSRIKEKPERIMSQIKRSSAMNSIMTGFIIVVLGVTMLASAVFLSTTTQKELQLAVSLGIFLLIGFVLIFFMNLMSTTGFYGAGAMILPSTLPFDKSDLEGLMLLAFARIFIAPIVLLLVVFPALVMLFFGVITGIFMLVALSATSILSLGALIKASGWFYTKTQSGDESVFSTIIRIGTGLGMVLGFVVAYSSINFIPQITDFVISISATLGSSVTGVLALLFPFSFGFVAAILAYGPVFPLITNIAAIVASAFYVFLGIRTYRTSGRTLRTLAVGNVSVSTTGSLLPIDLRVSSELRALIRKDLRVATRSLGSIILLVFPTFMFLIIFPSLSTFTASGIGSLTVLIFVGYATGFSGMTMIGLLNLDTQGAAIYEGLPLRTEMVLRGKIAIFAVAYVVSIIVVFVVLLANTLSSPFLLLIPLFQIPCGYSIGAACGAVIYRIRGNGHATAVNLVGDQAIVLVALLVCAVVGLVPLLGYALVLLNTGSHLLSVLTQLLIAIIETLLIHVSLRFVLVD